MFNYPAVIYRLLVLTLPFAIVSCGKVSTGSKTGMHPTEAMVYQRMDSLLSVISEPAIQGDTFDLAEFAGFGPDKTGSRDFLPHFKKLMVLISEKGSGVVYFRHSKGRSEWIKETEVYRFSGPIELESNLTLLLDPSVMLKFDFNPEAYTNSGQGVITRYEGTSLYGLSPCIRAFNKNNICIRGVEGSGAMPVITGEGEKWQEIFMKRDAQAIAKGKKPDYLMIRDINNGNIPLRERKFGISALRPDLVQFYLCNHVLMDGVFLKESPFWTIHTVFSENLTFRNLIFDAQVVNNDGIDVESSKNVIIENILFNNHDDNVVIKSGRDKEGMFGVDVADTELEYIKSSYISDNRLKGATENVVVRNCVFHGHHAVCIGSEMSGGARNILVADCFSPQYVYMALYLKGSRKRGGEVSEVYMINCRFNQVLNDVLGIIPNYDGDTLSAFPSSFHHVYMSGVEVAEVKGSAVHIYGWPDKLVQDVFVSNLRINQTGKEPLLIRQAKNINLRDVNVGGNEFNESINHSDSIAKPKQQV